MCGSRVLAADFQDSGCFGMSRKGPLLKRAKTWKSLCLTGIDGILLGF